MNGTRELVRLALRRDRILLPAWLAAFVLLAVTSAAATKDLFPTADSVVQAASLMNGTPALVAVYGHIYDLTSLGALAMLKALGTGSIVIAIFSIALVVRHTRAEEEAGRLELIGSGVVGRRAPLSAALLVAVGTNAALGLVTAVSVAATGLPVAGSVTFALAWMSVGMVFACVAAVVVQLVTSRRAAIGLATGVLGGVFVLRAIGDTVGPQWLTWLSPLGWGQQFRPYAGDRWWMFGIAAAVAIAVTAGAYRLVARRDHGAGMLPDRVGPVGASPWLSGPFSLAWRLQRGSLVGWTVGFVLYGLLVGSVVDSIDDMVGSLEAQQVFQQFGGRDVLTDAVLSAMFALLGVVASGYGVQAALRLHGEEAEHRADAVLTTNVSRARWAMSHVSVALAGTALLLVGAGLSAGVVHAARTGDAGQIGRVFVGALVQVPAAWVLTGIVVVLIGTAPRLAALSWAVLATFMLLGDLGSLLGLDQWLLDVSPFAHVPHMPGGAITATPLLWLIAATLVLTTTGLITLRRRDIG